MQYLNTYLQKIIERGNIELADSIKTTAENVGNQFLSKFSFLSHEIGLLFGNVQSGKTGQMFGIMCKATDLGFPVFLLLTTDNVVLQQQTLERVEADLDGFCICGENDATKFIQNSLIQPTIVVLKKNVRILKLWANIFKSTGFMRGNPLFIVDDEADAASLNTLINKKRKSSINKYLSEIQNDASSSMYLQVTGTPQAILLQTKESGWHPYFTYYFKPGKGYLGGDFFFDRKDCPNCIKYIEHTTNSTRNVVVRHLLVSAQMLSSGERVCNCLFHPSTRQAVHQNVADDVKKELEWCKNNFDEFSLLFQTEYEELAPNKTSKLSVDILLNKVKDMLLGNEIKVLILNGKSSVLSSEYALGSNIIIGGNTLGRGVTFPHLQTIYYTRTSKKPQADTMWQHSRMFGYDRDSGMMKIFIDKNLYKLFADINATNNSIIAQVEKGINDIKIYYPNGLNPTRKNVLDNNKVYIVSGGTNYYPLQTDNDSIEVLSELLSTFKDDEPYYQINLRLIKSILSHIVPSNDFKIQAYQSILDTLLAEKPVAQGILLVRRGRKVTQGTGALLSPNDWKVGGDFPKAVVLTMYQIDGDRGWKSPNIWVPNIKFPDNTVYYDIYEDKETD